MSKNFLCAFGFVEVTSTLGFLARPVFSQFLKLYVKVSLLRKVREGLANPSLSKDFKPFGAFVLKYSSIVFPKEA